MSDDLEITKGEAAVVVAACVFVGVLAAVTLWRILSLFGVV